MFNPPANVGDLNAAQKSLWSDVVHQWFIDAESRLSNDHNVPASDIRLFNLIDTPAGAAGPTADITWNGFPRKYKLVIQNVQTRWQTVETIVNVDLAGRQAAYFKQLPGGGFVRADNIHFRDQDEYCEWHSIQDSNGDLIKVVFTCENPEYWRFIAEQNPSLLHDLYQDLTGQQVQQSDLFFNEDIFIPDQNGQAVNQNGKYNPYNKWNTTENAIHLTHPANSLSAEVFLAADATILRKDSNGNPVTGSGDLICCAAYGGPDRSSDPTIGAAVNGLVQSGNSVTIDDPVGLYIHSLDPTPFEFPAGFSFDDCWNVIRGNKSDHQILRVEFARPDGGKLSDILVGGEPLQFGAQIAEFITVVILGRALDVGAGAPTAMDCTGKCCTNPNLPDLQTIVGVNSQCPPIQPPGVAATTAQPEVLNSLSGVKAYTR